MKLRPYFTMELVQKNNEKDLKIPILQPPDWKHPYWMSLYDDEDNDDYDEDYGDDTYDEDDDY